MKIAFVGHSFVYLRDRVKEMVKEKIRSIVGHEEVECYLGGYGDFDEICADACRDLKREGYNITLIYVTPYLTPSEQRKIKELQMRKLFDISIYPPIEKVPLRFAISRRNEWMMKNADLIISYVKYDKGGAYKTLEVARRNRKEIINLCD